LEDIERFLPRLHGALERIKAAIGTPEYDTILAEAFATAESISIDYGIMEHVTGHPTLPPVKVVPADIAWNDVGHWAAIADYAEADEDGNIVEGDAILVDSQNTIIHAGGRTVAVVGLRDVVVVETADAVLVCPRGRTQDVREIVARLEAAGRTDLL
jgi:mannose-1-phosphate guanylyltransferase